MSEEDAVTLEDRYDEMQEVGAGWGRTVLAAREKDGGRAVLITLGPPPGRMDSAQRERELRREAAVLARLDHRQITRLRENGVTDDGRFFFAVDHQESRPLCELLADEGALATARALELMVLALDGLLAMHEAGVVHRDLCPETILLVEGEVRVLLGAQKARVLDEGAGEGESALERLGATMGRPRYLAPERLRGGGASPASDLYAWGLALLECFTGASPYADLTDDAALKAQTGPDPVPMPAALAAEPHGELLADVLQKDPAKRPAGPDLLQAAQELLLQEELLGLGSPDVETRVSTLRKLAEQGKRGALWAIIKCLEDTEAEVRYHALGALDRLGARDALAAVQPLRDDPDPEVARRAGITWKRLMLETPGDGPPPEMDPDEDHYQGKGESRSERRTDITCPPRISGTEQRASVVVRLLLDRQGLEDDAGGPRRIEIHLHAPDFEVFNDATQVTQVKEGRDSNPVTFDLRPLVEQKAEHICPRHAPRQHFAGRELQGV